MKVFDLADENGISFAFEVRNALLGRRGLCTVVSRIPGVRITMRPAFWSWFREEEFCRFEVDGIQFVAWEPFGDNSRYWIGPDPPRPIPQLAVVRAAFAQASALRARFGA